MNPISALPVAPLTTASRTEASVRAAFERAGVSIGGGMADIEVLDTAFFDRVARQGSLGLGNAYIDGQWESPALDLVTSRLALSPPAAASRLDRWWLRALVRWRSGQSRARASEVVERHYELGNEFYARWLDPKMQYSCARWAGADSLETAQEQKLAAICQKLELRPGLRVLELGCGWGGLANYMARARGCKVTAINISPAQLRWARESDPTGSVDFVACDWRDVQGAFDRVVSVGMLEHVGPANYRAFVNVIHRVLDPAGLALLQTIGDNRTRAHPDRWILQHIFPNGHLPSIAQLGAAFEGRLVMEDWENLGPDYDRTLMAWHARFEAAWPEIAATGAPFDDRFRRMWRYYLLSSAGGFRARLTQLWQVVLTRHGAGRRWSRPTAAPPT